jgi:hypothetical protein
MPKEIQIEEMPNLGDEIADIIKAHGGEVYTRKDIDEMLKNCTIEMMADNKYRLILSDELDFGIDITGCIEGIINGNKRK